MHLYTIHKNGVNEGPFTLEQAEAGLADGTFANDQLAWRPGVPVWAPLRRRLDEDSGKAPPPVPAGAGHVPAKSGSNVGVIVAIVAVCAFAAIFFIGLLAAMAIPAFKKVRNNAIEKSMLNDARQISSAYNQCSIEEDRPAVTVRELRTYVPKLSNGIRLGIAPTVPEGEIILLDYAGKSADKAVLNKGGRFVLTHANYERRMSSRSEISGQSESQDDHTIVFDLDTGAPVK